MHVLFESVWKLHIGEIPQKPLFDVDYNQLSIKGYNLAELLPIAEQYRTKIDNPNWEDDFNKSKAIIERARKLISK